MVETADGVLVVSGQGLQVKVAQGCASLQGSQLVDSFDQVPFHVQIDQFHAVAQRIHVRDAILRQVHDPQPRVVLQRRKAVDVILAEVEHHEVGALRQRLNTRNALPWQRDSEDHLRRKFISQRFEDRNVDLAGEVVFFLAQLGEISEFLDVEVADVGAQQFGADVVVLNLGLALLRHRYI